MYDTANLFYPEDPIPKKKSKLGRGILIILLCATCVLLGIGLGRKVFPVEYSKVVPVNVISTKYHVRNHYHTDYATIYRVRKIHITEKPHPDPIMNPSPEPAPTVTVTITEKPGPPASSTP